MTIVDVMVRASDRFARTWPITSWPDPPLT